MRLAAKPDKANFVSCCQSQFYWEELHAQQSCGILASLWWGKSADLTTLSAAAGGSSKLVKRPDETRCMKGTRHQACCIASNTILALSSTLGCIALYDLRNRPQPTMPLIRRIVQLIFGLYVALCASLKWNHWEKGVEYAQAGDNVGGMYALRQGLRAAPCMCCLYLSRSFVALLF